MTLSARNAPAVQLLAAPPKVELCLEECEDERRQ